MNYTRFNEIKNLVLLVPDPTLLDTSEVELVDLKMLDDSPVVVVQFTCQQVCSCSCR